jgi:hypothetical protein
MPPTSPGTVLHIRQPFSKELVTVMLGGKELRTEQLAKAEVAPAAGGAAAAALWQPLEAPPGDRYRYERLLQREAQAARDVRGAWSDEDDDLAQWMTKQASQAREAPVRPARRAAAPGAADSGPTAAPVATKKLPVRAQAQARVAALASRPAVPEPLAKRVRTVDFMSAADEVGLLNKPVLDLSRFGGDSSDDEAGGGGSGRKTIPQIDGAGDSEEDSSSSNSSSDGDSSGSGDDEEDSAATSAGTNASTRASSGGEEELSEPSDGEEGGAGGSAAAGAADGGQAGSGEAPPGDATAAPMEEGVWQAAGAEPAPEWMHRAFASGVTFFQSEPVAQMEASWRAWREGATRDYREKRRQAVRQAARPSGGARGRR